MLLSVLVYLQALKWAVPTAIILGSAPIYVGSWMLLRIATAVLPRRYYRRADDVFYSSYQRLILFFFENYTGVEIYLYGDTDTLTAKQENVLFMSNHQSTVDWVICDILAIRQGALGTVRYVLKDGLRYLPYYGFYLGQHDCLYVRRSGRFDEGRASRQLTRLQRDRTPTWFVVFPEGTRFNPELPDVIKKSQDFARSKGFPVFQYVLTPRYRAVQIGLVHMRSYLDAVYDITIAYSNTVAKDTSERITASGMPDFLGGCSPELHLHIRRIPMADVPQSEDDLPAWLNNRFEEKERLLKYFYSAAEDGGKPRKRFPGNREKSALALHQTAPSMILWGGLFAAAMTTADGRTLYWKISLGIMAFGCVYMSIRS